MREGSASPLLQARREAGTVSADIQRPNDLLNLSLRWPQQAPVKLELLWVSQ